MAKFILSPSTFDDFSRQAEIALEIFWQLSAEDKVAAIAFWDICTIKIRSRNNTREILNTQGNDNVDRSSQTVASTTTVEAQFQDQVQNILESSVQNGKGKTQTQVVDDEDRAIDKVLDEVIHLEAETQFLAEMKPDNRLLTENSLSLQDHSCVSATLEVERMDAVTPAEIIPVENNEQKFFQCPLCSSTFDTEKSREDHRKQNHANKPKPKPHKCEKCPAAFTNKGNLNVHLKSHRLKNERPYECTECKSRFARSSNLRRHLLSHQGVKPFRCSICQTCFTEKRSLTIHLRIHSGERPYSCPHCPKTFAQSNVLTNHIRVHTDEKKYPCPSCAKSFKQKAHLMRHTAYIHKGAVAKTKVCPKCNWQFVTKGDLDRHLRSKSHAGEKRFLCAQCGKRFMRQTNLTEHINTNHV